MGKSLKGKKCGAGICQRKDGKYTARFLAKDGSRREKHFLTLSEAKHWLADAKYLDKHDLMKANSEMTVDEWYSYWMDNLICDLSPNTKRNYKERYKINIQPVIGGMRMCDVKPMHCKIVLNRMDVKYAGGTIKQAYIAMGTMFRSAVMKVLQQLLGHASIKTTMDRYVHVTDESLEKAVQLFAAKAS